MAALSEQSECSKMGDLEVSFDTELEEESFELTDFAIAFARTESDE